MGTLYLVSTPIGNLEDITLRAMKILSQVEVIACEDTRKTGYLLKHLSLPKKALLSYYEQNELKRVPQMMRILRAGKDVALVSNAGMPTLSDPGYRLVRECIRQKIKIVPIPGPSAILTALVASGFPTDKFLFLGYLPKRQTKRKKALLGLTILLSSNIVSVVAFESPHRLLQTLLDIKEVLGEINLAICGELTKIHEEIRRETISSSIAHFTRVKPRGEITLVLSLKEERPA